MPDDRGTAPPRWRIDFPILWEQDHYVTRRELAKFLVLGSGLLVLGTAAVGAFGRRLRPRSGRPVRVAAASDVPPGGSYLFRYPTDADPCILVRLSDGRLAAYSQVCTHLSCAVLHRPGSDDLDCPCHKGVFSATDGRPIAGPPQRRLPRIRLEERGGDIYATGVEV